MPLRLRMIPSSRLSGGGGPTTERAIEFDDTVGLIRVGRRTDLELPLPFPALSGVHARIVRADSATEGWLIEDLGSKNGTFLKGKRLEPGDRRPLSSGAEISFAHVKLIFDGKSASAAAAPETSKTDSVVSHHSGPSSATPSITPPITPSKSSNSGKRPSKDKIPVVEKRVGEAGLRPAEPIAGGAGPSQGPASTEGTGTIARRLVSDLFAAEPGKNPPTLTVVSGVPGGGSFKLVETDRRYTFGRDKSCDFRVRVEEISREHAAFSRRWNGIFVTDLGSKNGVRVNAVQAQEQRLQDGDLIQIGPIKLRLFDPEDRYLRDVANQPDDVPPENGLHPQAGPPAAPIATNPPGPMTIPMTAPLSPPGAPSPNRLSRPDLHPAVAGALAAEDERRPLRPSVRMKLAAAWGKPKTSRASIVISAMVLLTVAFLVVGFILSD